jgi:GMP synthase-like glutamine amidotransferase
MLQIRHDPAFDGVARQFEIMESHCGQIEFAPKGWVQIATCGKGGKTRMQCLRVKDRYIYAAQFHIEMEGTPANSRTIMANFLALARRWGGYNPRGQPVAPPEPLDE